MKQLTANDLKDWVEKANQWCQENIRPEGDSLFIPAGDTPTPLYKNWETHCPKFLNNARLMSVDEVLSEQNPKHFEKFFTQQLPTFQNKLKRVEENTQVARLAILGVGTNGHIAFHEPGIDFSLIRGEVPLARDTCQKLGISEKSLGLTFGLGAFLKCDAVLLLMRGESKRKIYSKMASKSDKTIPVIHLIENHPNVTILLDNHVDPRM